MLGGSSRFIHSLAAGRRQTIVCYGTSLTEGGAWTKQLAAWLATRFPSSTLNMINSGMSGKNSADGAAPDALESKVLRHHPDTVFLEFAINDAKSMTVAQSQLNLLSIISDIWTRLPQTEIILMTMNSCWDAPNSSNPASLRPNLASYYQSYHDVARELHLLLIDHYPNWMALQKNQPAMFKEYLPDGLHPIAAGYAAIVTPVITAALAPEVVLCQ